MCFSPLDLNPEGGPAIDAAYTLRMARNPTLEIQHTTMNSRLSFRPFRLFRNRRALRNSLIIIGLMPPFPVVMIPLYLLMGRTLKLTNTFPGTLLVYLAMTMPLTIFCFSQFIKGLFSGTVKG